MDKGKKRERSVNFTETETEKLVSLVEAKQHIIENKKSGAVTWQEKVRAWQAIEAEFNSSGEGTYRDSKHLKLKYEALKRDTRKKARAVSAERNRTDGGTDTVPPLTPLERKIKEMISLSVEGCESTSDSEQHDAAVKEEPNPLFESYLEEENIDSKLALCYDEPVSKRNYLTPETDAAANTSKHIKYALSFDEPVSRSNCLTPETDAVANTSKHSKYALCYDESVSKTNCPALEIDAVANTSKQIEPDAPETTKQNRTRWKPVSLKSKKRPTFCKPKEKRLLEAKMEIVNLQKKILEEELVEKVLRKQSIRLEIAHKNELFELEKEQMLLKIDKLKNDLFRTSYS